MADKNAKKNLIYENPNRTKPNLNDPNRTKTFIFKFRIVYFHLLTFNF